MDLVKLLTDAVKDSASDIFIVAGRPFSYKKSGSVIEVAERLMPENTNALVNIIYQLAGDRDISHFLAHGDDDFSFALRGVARFRVSTYKQRGSFAAVIRVINFTLPDASQLGIPENILQLGDLSKGMVLVTGPAGSGKSTTLACIIDYINQNKKYHIITLEDPLEFLHSHKNSIVSQREISADTDSYIAALRASLRQSPDVILLGEMRDYETINVAMTAAETGHLVISTLHTVGAANTIDRIVDVFPPDGQQQVRVQLSMVLQAVISQQLLTTKDNRLAPAFEIMYLNNAIRNMIRENKIHQIDNVIATSMSEGMVSMNNSLLRLFQQGRIDKETCINYSTDPEQMRMRLI